MKGDIAYLKGKGFDANPQNINRNGRPRKQLSHIIEEIKDMGYKQPSQSEIVEICILMLTFREDDLMALSINEEYPMIMRIIATHMIGERGFEAIEKILDRTMGKPRLSPEASYNRNSNNPLSSKSTEELIIMIKD